MRSVGVQLLLTGSRSICTYEAESRRGAEVSFHWNQVIEIAISLGTLLTRLFVPESKDHNPTLCLIASHLIFH